jgi:hypothetical protein
MAPQALKLLPNGYGRLPAMKINRDSDETSKYLEYSGSMLALLVILYVDSPSPCVVPPVPELYGLQLTNDKYEKKQTKLMRSEEKSRVLGKTSNLKKHHGEDVRIETSLFDYSVRKTR